MGIFEIGLSITVEEFVTLATYSYPVTKAWRLLFLSPKCV